MQQTTSLPGGRTGFPLPPEDVARLVAARLRAAGRPRDLLKPEAVVALARHSTGDLRRVKALADQAIAVAALEGGLHVGARQVEQAAAMHDSARATRWAASAPCSAPRARRVARGVAMAAFAMLLAAGGGWALSGRLFGKQEHSYAGAGVVFLSTPPHAEAAAPSPADVTPKPRLALARTDQPAQTEPSSRAEAPAVLPPPLPTSTPAFRAKRPQAVLPGLTAPARETLPPAVDAGLAFNAPVRFRGSMVNDTMGQSGRLSLVITRQDPSSGAIVARFHASAGLVGDGELMGRLLGDGRIQLFGRLMMERNPFDCELSGRVADSALAGSATFARIGGNYVARGTFALTRP